MSTKTILKTITKSQDFSLYEIPQEKENFKTYISSTPETRNLTTNPFLVGKEYRDALEKAITKTLNNKEIKQLFENKLDEQLNVLHFLRGGLNFGILDALGSLGKNRTRASFMTSERAKDNGKWIIRDDQYNKLTLSNNSTIFIGDIVATGITLKVGLEKIAEQNKKEHHVIMFTLGGKETEDILIEQCKNFKSITIIYIEGRFHMANPETKARIKIDGTDLMPLRAALAPEFEQALQENPIKALERCIVYDGGSRGFYPSHHFRDVLEYIEQVEQEMKKGATAYDLILERWENAENLSEEVKQKLKESKTAEDWIKNRKEKLNSLLL